MHGVSFQHPSGGRSKNLIRRTESFPKDSPQNARLEGEVFKALERLENLDQGLRDQSRERGYVHVESKNGRVVESGSFRYRNENGQPYRDRDGYWEVPTRKSVLDSVVYTRQETDAAGQPLRSVTVSKHGDLLSKTIQDQHGKSIAVGGKGRFAYEVDYFPGDHINSRF